MIKILHERILRSICVNVHVSNALSRSILQGVYSCQNEQKGFLEAHPNLECLMILNRESGTFDVALANKAH